MMLAENELPLFERPAAATGVCVCVCVCVSVYLVSTKSSHLP